MLIAGLAVSGLGFATAACQQKSDNSGGGGNGAANGAAAENSAAADSAAAAPAAPALSPPTGALAIASDAGLPEQCKTYLREAQACLDSMPGPADGMNPHMLRSTVNNDRTTWAREQTPELLATACERHVASLREQFSSRYKCQAR